MASLYGGVLREARQGPVPCAWPEGVAAMHLCSCCMQPVCRCPSGRVPMGCQGTTTAETASYDLGSWPDHVLGDILGESLGDGDTHGRCFPC